MLIRLPVCWPPVSPRRLREQLEFHLEFPSPDVDQRNHSLRRAIEAWFNVRLTTIALNAFGHDLAYAI